ncbi:Uncharacterised protein [uncultured archaeon]|nr:Uncharacterised protein [uncultured archaeon]
MSVESSRKLSGSLDEITFAHRENLKNWRVNADDLLAILVLSVLTLGAAAYIQSMIMSCLENAGSISVGLTSP